MTFIVPRDRTLRIALLGTALGKMESTKEERYHEDLVRPKFPTPQFGVFRLQYFLAAEFVGQVHVDVFDPGITPELAILQALRARRYHIIGMSPIRIALGDDLRFMEAVHNTSQDSVPLYVAGGIEAASNYEHLLLLMPWLHFCVAGFGEITLGGIIREVLARKPESSLRVESCLRIRGIIGRANGRIVCTPCGLTRTEFDHYNAYTGENIPYQDYWAASSALLPEGLAGLAREQRGNSTAIH